MRSGPQRLLSWRWPCHDQQVPELGAALPHELLLLGPPQDQLCWGWHLLRGMPWLEAPVVVPCPAQLWRQVPWQTHPRLL